MSNKRSTFLSYLLGRVFLQTALVLGIVIFYAALIIALNLIVDILYGVIDPRVRQR